MANSLRNKIKHLCYKGYLSERERDRLLNALDDADRINSESKPCEDCISRAEALKHSHIEYDDDGEGHRVIYVEDIEELPSVTPKTRWIPVSERLPKDHEKVLIYLSSNRITIGLYRSHRLPFMDKPIGWGTDAPHDWSSDEVIAWMPLPEPYKAESEE